MKERLAKQRKLEIAANLKQNWYFPISAMAFFSLNALMIPEYFIGMLIAFVGSVVIASRTPSMLAVARQNSLCLRVLCGMTAVGICWGGQVAFYTDWIASSKTKVLEELIPLSVDIPGVLSVFGAVVAVVFVYLYVLAFWKKMIEIILENGILGGIRKKEWILYGSLLLTAIVLVVAVFLHTNAFYGTTDLYNIVYSSDSSALVKGNAYLALTHKENDLRQPLFAVFAAPFIGIPYLLGRVFRVSFPVQAILLNIVQLVMLFAANLMLAKTMKLDPIKRACFILLSSSTYTHFLFILMMEQYLVAYFWLVFCMYLIFEKQRPERIALWGAGGTLLTSMALLPFMSDKNPIRNFKDWFIDILRYALEFVAVILLFCRFDVLCSVVSRMNDFGVYTGKSVAFIEKIYQYSAFVRNCFFMPAAGLWEDGSWQQNPVTDINITGVVIFLLVIISAFLNRKKKFSLFASGWVFFSVAVLPVLGWGASENGQILYSLYFGWAFFVLLFQLVEKIENKLNINFLVPIFCIVSVAGLVAINVPGMVELLRFAITYYPV